MNLHISNPLKWLLLIVVLLLAGRIVLDFRTTWQREASAQIQQLQDVIARKQALAGHEAEIETCWQEVQTVLAEAQARYHQDVRDPAALQLALQQKVEAIAAELDITVRNVAWQHISQGALIRTPVRFSLEMPPPALWQLIYRLESDAYFYSINRLHITTRQRSTRIMADLDISAYGLAPTAIAAHR